MLSRTSLPARVSSGGEIAARDINKLIDTAAAIIDELTLVTLRPSADIGVNRTPGGTFATLKKRAGKTGPAPDSSSSDDSEGSFGSEGPGDNGSGKDTAIVPAPWSSTGYAALFVMEAPEVRFDDIIRADIAGRVTRVPMDPRFVAVCEPYSISCCGCSVDRPGPAGIEVLRDAVIITVSRWPWARPRVVTMRLTGIRKGFKTLRFPSRTGKQFLENEAFINSAYSK